MDRRGKKLEDKLLSFREKLASPSEHNKHLINRSRQRQAVRKEHLDRAMAEFTTLRNQQLEEENVKIK
jgi:hypothetical protein